MRNQLLRSIAILAAGTIGHRHSFPIIVHRYFALVPAAGAGSRFGPGAPKQYRLLAERPLLYHTLSQLAQHPQIEQVFVVLAPGDAQFRLAKWDDLEERITPLYCGGETRAASVYNGLIAARDAVGGDDWILVHDAARPCLTAHALSRLIVEVGDDEVGGLLAVPVADTLKRSDGAGRVSGTQEREGLWQAQTPQMFRYGFLVEALRRCGGAAITDEASAIELMGLHPKIVMGETCNLKVTYPQDIELAALILNASLAHNRSADAEP